MKLSLLLNGLSVIKQSAEEDVDIAGLAIDSRQVGNQFLFAAIQGTQADGFAYIPKAIELGAVAILCDRWYSDDADNVIVIQVPDVAEAIAEMAHRFYGEPSLAVKLFGVTGTNGKTTIATLLYKLFRSLGYSCGLISTVENKIDDEIIPATHTTPDAINISALLAKMVKAGCSHVFMESSSHAIHQKRIAALQFHIGIFSNITHDHLDYHKTFDEYIRVKKSFFDTLPKEAYAISNLDDKRGAIMLQNTVAHKKYYSLRTLTDFKGKVMENNITGLVMQIDGKELHTRLVGEFNAYNMLAVYASAVCAGEATDEVLAALSNLTGATGRFDFVIAPVTRKVGIVDYAHTPDALLNVLTTIKNIVQGAQQIITVVGCGGNRDTTKRPIMAEVACQHSHKTFFTSDNPRFEDPELILDDMERGLKSEYKRRSKRIVNRREAIAEAVAIAQPGDVILIAGKGHENYQEVKGVKHHFDDKEEIEKLFDQENVPGAQA